MKQVIIGLSGKASSGKDSTANFLKEKIGKGCKIYSFADKLKRDVCINLLGLSHKQVYGTNEDKDTFTHLCWENMPGVMTPTDVSNIDGGHQYSPEEIVSDFDIWEERIRELGLLLHSPGKMTAREVMQYVGTNVFRKMYPNIWVDAVIKQIKADRAPVAIVSDMRFESEATALKNIGAQLWRFTRNPLDMQHDSEIGLDNYVDWDFVLDNISMPLKSQFGWCWKEYCQVSPFEESPYETDK